jgi:hypothetical protein
MPAQTDVTICNLALTMLGADRITSLLDDTENARKCNSVYTFVRDEVLRAHPWNFAIKRAVLAELATPPVFGYDHQFQIPSDCLRVFEVSSGWSDVESETEFEIEGKALLTDMNTCYIRYIFRQTDPTQFDSSFVNAIAARLAAEMAYSITGHGSMATAMMQIYEQKMSAARSADAQESGLPNTIGGDVWNQSRI